jgi:preprotein translocase subunit SecA
MTPEQRRAAYNADITYGTNNEFGFDYLRDNMAWSVDEMVQRGHRFAVVDEVDSILIDEARTPLIISGPADQSPKWYADFAKLARRLTKDTDYEVDIKKRTVGILDAGVEKVEDWLGVENLYETVNTPLVGFLNNAIRAKELFERDKEYVVQNGEVLIVDEHTGRILAGRRYNEGLHQAIEAKEGVEIKAENQTLATITLQNFFRMYDKLSGMTGTAMTEAAEFNQIYKLGVVPIPTNRPNVRQDMSDVIYRTESAKFAAVVEDIQECQDKGQPVLVGTASVEKSEVLSGLLKRAGVRHEVLNAKYHEREAAIVAEAGRKGAVTVATNMAGRGTDIILGGNPELRAAADLAARGLDPVETPEDYEAAWPDALAKAEESVAAEHEEVVGLGGLYVLATERHESRRIDNQLRGRSARQGDPGRTRFYLSLEDDLMKRFNAAMVDSFLTRFNVPDDVPIDAKMVSRAIQSAQGQVEAQNFEIRKNVLKYDEVLNRQRQVIYAERQRVLRGENLEDEVRTFLDDTIAGAVANFTAEGYPEEWDLEQLWTELTTLYPVGVSIEAVEAEADGRSGLSADLLTQLLQDDAQAAYDRRTEELTEPVVRELERQVILNVLDRKWREHLYEMDYLQEGIGLRAMAQRDPLVEYQKEGYDLFAAMMAGIKEETVGYMFHVQPNVEAEEAEEAGEAEAAPHISAPGLGDDRPRQVQYSSPTLDEQAPSHVERGTLGGSGTRDPQYADVPRNAPCPCGSGKKFKRCHGDPRNAA